MTVSFCGQCDAKLDSSTVDKIFETIETLIIKRKSDTFMCGACRDYNVGCVEILRRIKSKYPAVRLVAVAPCLTQSYVVISNLLAQNYDEVIYPPIEQLPLAEAIAKRNEWMIDNCDLLIIHTTFKTKEIEDAVAYAKQKNKAIVLL